MCCPCCRYRKTSSLQVAQSKMSWVFCQEAGSYEIAEHNEFFANIYKYAVKYSISHHCVNTVGARCRSNQFDMERLLTFIYKISDFAWRASSVLQVFSGMKKNYVHAKNAKHPELEPWGTCLILVSKICMGRNKLSINQGCCKCAQCAQPPNPHC